MRLLLSPLALVLLVLVWPRTPAPSDPCDVAGTYALDREPIVAGVIASMDASLADLGPRPAGGSMAELQWAARRDAFQNVRAEALSGGIVPRMTLALTADGRATHRVSDAEMPPRGEHTGRWHADAACRVITLDMGDDEPTTAHIEGDRLVFENDGDRHDGPFQNVAFDRVR